MLVEHEPASDGDGHEAIAAPALQRNRVSWMRGESTDPIGPVFRHEGRYYRAVRPAAAAHARRLFDEGVVAHLQETGFLNRQEIAELQIDGSPFTIRSEPADFLIVARYYSFTLLKRAALKWLDASLYLNERGLGLVDGHYANFAIFRNGDPRWFDLGSIIALPPEPHLHFGLRQFARYFLDPLLAVARHPALQDMVRNHALLSDDGMAPRESAYLTGFEMLQESATRARVYQAMREAVAAIAFQWPETSWSHYAVQRINRVSAAHLHAARPSQEETGPDRPGKREGSVLSTLARELRPGDTVLDLGGNDGYFGLHAAAAGAKAIVSDSDEEALARGLSRLDREPGWTAAFVAGDAMKNAHEADIVLALALTHHLRLSQSRTFDVIARKLARNARRVLLVEFMPWGLSVKGPPKSLPPDYTLEGFLTQFGKAFASVEVVAHNVAEAGHPRVLVACRK